MLSPAEAAALLGVASTTPVPDIENAYLARLATLPDDDVEGRDRLTAARDALVAAARWQAPTGAPGPRHAQAAGAAAGAPLDPASSPAPSWPQAVPPVSPVPFASPSGGYPSGGSPSADYPSAEHPSVGFPPAPGYTPPPPAYTPPLVAGAQPPAPYSQPQSAPYPTHPPYVAQQPGHPGQPAQPGQPYPPYAGHQPGQPGQPAQPGQPYPPYAGQQPGHPYPPHQPYPPYAPPARRGPSTGAILGWVLGGFGVLLVLVVVAVVVIVSSVRPTSSVGDAGAGSGGGSANEYVVDGVRVQYGDEGWDFTLTSPQDCPAATVTVGFSSTYEGDIEDEITDTVSLEAGQPHVYSVPYDASNLQYASIDAVDCAGGGDGGSSDSGSGDSGSGDSA